MDPVTPPLGNERICSSHVVAEARTGHVEDQARIAGAADDPIPESLELRSPTSFVGFVGMHQEQIDVAIDVAVSAARGSKERGVDWFDGPSAKSGAQLVKERRAEAGECLDSGPSQVKTVGNVERGSSMLIRQDDALTYEPAQYEPDATIAAAACESEDLSASEWLSRAGEHLEDRCIQGRGDDPDWMGDVHGVILEFPRGKSSSTGSR